MDRHWIPRAVENGETINGAAVLPLAVLASQQWANAVERRVEAGATRPLQRPRVDGADPAVHVKRAKTNEEQAAAGDGDAGEVVRDVVRSDEGTDTESVLKLQTKGVDGTVKVVSIHTVVANALFPVLRNLVEDLGIDVQSPVGTTAPIIPLDAEACPADALRRLVAIADAVVEAENGDPTTPSPV